MDEAARCEQLILIREGDVLAVETPDRLREETGESDLDAAFLHLIEGRP
jgi:ABC-2 type transport system ATP-binding protein